jgi:hypothetical protein
VSCEPRAQVVISGKSLNNTGWEEVLGKLGELEITIWCEWPEKIWSILGIA